MTAAPSVERAGTGQEPIGDADRGCDVVFFVTRPDALAESGPVGDYLATEDFSSTHPHIRCRVIHFNDVSTTVTIEPERALVSQGDDPPVDLMQVSTLVYFPLSFEPEDTALSPVATGGQDHGYDHRQWRAVGTYLETTLSRIGRCINTPDRARLATNKLVQLAGTAKHGLAASPALVTNTSQDAITTLAATGRWVRKNVSEGDGRARLCDASHNGNGTLSIAPALYQPFLDATCELRLYAVGDEFTAVTIPRSRNHEPGDDVRLEAARRHEYAVTDEFEGHYPRLRGYLEDLGLTYAALDCLPIDDRLVVLDVNPNGTWHFLPEPIRNRITAAFHRLIAAEVSVARRSPRETCG